jgi:hypothetical protein
MKGVQYVAYYTLNFRENLTDGIVKNVSYVIRASNKHEAKIVLRAYARTRNWKR